MIICEPRRPAYQQFLLEYSKVSIWASKFEQIDLCARRLTFELRARDSGTLNQR